MNWLPLGELSVLVYCDDEGAAATLAAAARRANWPWLVDVVQSYASVAVFFDRDAVDGTVPRVEADGRHARIASALASVEMDGGFAAAKRRHLIPVCYEKQLDLVRVAEHTGLSKDDIIAGHSAMTYTIYAIGFCPGFPYLGYLPAELARVPRLPSPRLRVPVGSVGLTGRQTGIYTEPSPGGWNIIGQTPLELVNVADSYFPLRTGDEVVFERIDEVEFGRIQGWRLPTRTAENC